MTETELLENNEDIELASIEEICKISSDIVNSVHLAYEVLANEDNK